MFFKDKEKPMKIYIPKDKIDTFHVEYNRILQNENITDIYRNYLIWILIEKLIPDENFRNENYSFNLYIKNYILNPFILKIRL
jgi:hypothetical protein